MSCRIAVLGGGLTGLSASWFLQEAGFDVRLFEQGSRTGGLVQTINREGFLFELGPYTMRGGDYPSTAKLIKALGLESQLLFPSSSDIKRYVYADGSLQAVPSRLHHLFFSPLTKGLFRSLIKDWRHLPQLNGDESISCFFERHFGQHVVDYLVDPFVSGIYAGDSKRLSLQACFPSLKTMEEENGSLLKSFFKSKKKKKTSFELPQLAKVPCFSFKEGMQTLTDALTNKLAQRVHLNQQIVALKKTDKKLKIVTFNGEERLFDYIISTMPAYQLASVLGYSELKDLQFSSVVSVHFGYHKDLLKKKGFGHLSLFNPSSPVLGMIWGSSLFPTRSLSKNATCLSIMLGGARHPSVEGLSDETLIQFSLQAVFEQLGITEEPDVHFVHRANHAIAQYEVGYEEWKKEVLKRIGKDFPGLFLAGPSFSGISMHDSIAKGHELALDLVKIPIMQREENNV